MATKKQTKRTVGTSVSNPVGARMQIPMAGPVPAAAVATVLPGGPPTPGSPVPPGGFVPPPVTKMRELTHPMAVQEAHARAVALELSALATQPVWQGVEASGMSSPGQLSALLTVAANWSDETKNAKSWGSYAGVQRATIWDAVLSSVEELAPTLTAYIAANPTMAPSLTATQAFLDARGIAAERGVVTRTAPAVARQRATKLGQQAAAANAKADAEEAAAAALAHGTGDATVVTPAPSSPTTPSATTPSAAPASGTGGGTIT